jgi:hypothetical protein
MFSINSVVNVRQAQKFNIYFIPCSVVDLKRPVLFDQMFENDKNKNTNLVSKSTEIVGFHILPFSKLLNSPTAVVGFFLRLCGHQKLGVTNHIFVIGSGKN